MIYRTKASHETKVDPRWEWPLVLGLLLAALFHARLALNDVPPGLHHDEVIIGQVAKDILRGHLAIYFTGGYGQEPLYHYVLAGFFALLGASAFVLRLTSAFVALLGLAVTYRFTRRLFSPAVAVGALAWMSISLWPVFFSRVGLRGITLPLLTTLTAYFLWKALHASRAHVLRCRRCIAWSVHLHLSSQPRFPRDFCRIFHLSGLTPSLVTPLLVTHYSCTRRRVGVFFVTALARRRALDRLSHRHQSCG